MAVITLLQLKGLLHSEMKHVVNSYFQQQMKHKSYFTVVFLPAFLVTFFLPAPFFATVVVLFLLTFFAASPLLFPRVIVFFAVVPDAFFTQLLSILLIFFPPAFNSKSETRFAPPLVLLRSFSP